jgi:hypothetical protein
LQAELTKANNTILEERKISEDLKLDLKKANEEIRRLKKLTKTLEKQVETLSAARTISLAVPDTTRPRSPSPPVPSGSPKKHSARQEKGGTQSPVNAPGTSAVPQAVPSSIHSPPENFSAPGFAGGNFQPGETFQEGFSRGNFPGGFYPGSQPAGPNLAAGNILAYPPASSAGALPVSSSSNPVPIPLPAPTTTSSHQKAPQLKKVLLPGLIFVFTLVFLC